ncbi:MAG: hypothetical protein IJ447_04245 [Clostridia bacterium]|nr:hypothetical protein [Clostridia bacterium]
MEEIFEYKGYNFKAIKSINKQRPYRVRCIETNTENDSVLSYIDAASLLITPIISAKEKLLSDSKNAEYVHNVFEKLLIGKTQSESDELVKNEIVYRNLINGKITRLTDTERFPEYIIYCTEYFRVRVIFQSRIPRKAIKIEVEDIQ